jgi:hypothetical protein
MYAYTPGRRRILFLGWLIGSLLLPGGASRAAEVTMLALEGDELLDRAIWTGLARRPLNHVHFAPSGAAGGNVEYENKTADKWFIEGQRYGADLVEAGLLRDNPEILEAGWKAIDWGFQRQSVDGGFAGTGDPFHSTSFFVEATARALLLSQQAHFAGSEALRRKYAPRLKLAAQWMLEPKVLSRGKSNNRPYVHRRWLVAAAWGLTAKITGDKELLAAAAESARDGISLQLPDGVNPEKDGFDVSYQAVGVMFAARYYTVCEDPKLRDEIKKMITRALDWERTKIDAEGQVTVEGSTRVTTEVSRSGTAKTIDYKAIITALVMGSELTGRAEFREAAWRVARGRNWIKD